MDDYRHEDCDFCHDSFGEGRDLVQHEAVEHDHCEVCQTNFGGPNELRQHSRVHKPRSYECFGCGPERKFESYSAMLIHLESGKCKTSVEALDAYAAQCYQRKKYIVKGFNSFLRNRKRLSRRAKLPSDENGRGWECGICQKKFFSKAGLSNHLSSSIHDPEAYKCPCCEQRFAIISALVQHVESERCEETIRPQSSVFKMLHYVDHRVARSSKR